MNLKMNSKIHRQSVKDSQDGDGVVLLTEPEPEAVFWTGWRREKEDQPAPKCKGLQ